MPIGEGIWATVSSVAPNALTVADTQTGNAAWFGTVEEHGDPSYYAMRLKIRDGRITGASTTATGSAHVASGPGPLHGGW